MGGGCRLVFQERIGPAFEDAAFDIHSQFRTLRVQDNLNILAFQAFANAERLAEQLDIAVNGDLTNERHATRSDRQSVREYSKTCRQFLEFLAPSKLLGRQAT